MSDSRVTVEHDSEYCLFSAEVPPRHGFLINGFSDLAEIFILRQDDILSRCLLQ